MVTVISLWELPRSRGTSVSYALFNGLRALGYKCEFWDEPLYPRQLLSIHDEKEKAEYIRNIKTPQSQDTDFVIQKHQAKWLFDERTRHVVGDDLDWIKSFKNIVLFRDPYETIVSHQKELSKTLGLKSRSLTLEQVGIEQLFSVFQFLKEEIAIGNSIVVDSNELLKFPTQGMQKLCKLLEIPFSEKMINWTK